MTAAVEVVATNPRAGNLIVGSGGCRKVRVAGKGRGKSSGYRGGIFFAGEDVPVFLLAVLAKVLQGGTQRNETGNEELARKLRRASFTQRI